MIMEREEMMQMMQMMLQQQAQMYEQQMNHLMEKTMKCKTKNESYGMSIPKLNIPNFSGLSNEDVGSWLFLANQNLNAARVENDQKVLIIGGYLRDAALQWYRRQCCTCVNMSWEVFSDALVRMFLPVNHQERLRTMFDNLKQTKGINQYITEFMKLMNQVESMSEIDKVHAFVRGLAHRTRAEVGYLSPKTLDEALRIASEYENHYFGSSSLVSSFSRNYNDRKTWSYENKNDMMDINMMRAGSERDRMKKIDSKRSNGTIRCFSCNEPGHKANVCPKRRTKELNQMQIEKWDKPEDSYLIQFEGMVDNKPVSCVLDTGAVKSVLSGKAAKRMGIDVLETTMQIKVADGSTAKPIGITGPLCTKVFDTVCNLEFIVTNLDRHDVLLGLDWFKETGAVYHPSKYILKFPPKIFSIKEGYEIPVINNIHDEDLLSSELSLTDDQDIEGGDDWNIMKDDTAFLFDKSLTHDEKKRLELFLEDNKEIFAKEISNLGTCNVTKHKISLIDESPIYVHPYRRSIKEKKDIKEEVEKMLAAGIIRPSKSPWSFPIVLVPKRDGTKRFCIDYRKLNTVSKHDNFPMPRMDDILDRFQGSLWFSKLDLKSGYWQIALEEDSIEKTAFSTTDGHYEFVKLPFGIRNAPAEFSRIMCILLGGLDFVEIYLDDMTIHSKNLEDHMKHLEIVFSKLKEANLKLNITKCTFALRSIELLGHIVGNNRVKMDPKKTEAIQNLQVPHTIKEVQTFLGITGYYRKFVKGYADIAAPLFSLLKKESVWNWNSDSQEAFEKLKKNLMEYPILRIPNLSKKFQIYTDASGLALGAILSQKDDNGEEYVCCYSSRLLHGAELHYGISEKECLAVVWAIRLYHPYLHGERFEVITDHSALKWLMNIEDPTGRLARWSIYLQAYDFEIIHRKGSSHGNVDALSRSILLVEDAEDSGSKGLDPWEDYSLLSYLKNKRHQAGIAKKQCKRVENLAKQYKLENGKLFISKATVDGKVLEVPKPEDRLDIVKSAHLGHFQVESTISRIKGKYYWKKMNKNVEDCIKNCLPCLRHQPSNKLEHPARNLTINGVFDRVGIDLVFGLPETAEGYIGVLVIVEYLTKFPYVVPVKSKSAKEIASHLFLFISLFGPPKEILSDQGREFVNSIVDELSKINGIERRVTSSYNPRTNGLTERFNQTLITSLRKHAEKEPEKWNHWIPYVLLAYRSRTQSSTGYSPFELLFGREMNSFESWSANSMKGTEEESLFERSIELRRLYENLYPKAHEKIQSSQEAQRKYQNARSKKLSKQIKNGTEVFIRIPRMVGKMQAKYIGPFKTDGITPLGNYWLVNEGGIRLATSYPISRLKVKNSSVSEDKRHDDSFKAEEILDHKFEDGKISYFVKWKEYPMEDCSWEQESHFETVECIEDYWRKKHGVVEDNDKAGEEDLSRDITT
jgi:RNase H-like domain found in reverse transcriptase/Reverse transcriptase (RNA-dependent DNA polymerase)/Ty3 transposon capsid-like protein/Integrase zinc binding domain/Chromo (CHRromatin Organisation MOdifier) domain/gag-polyprotein putative aspartyl protease